MKFNLFIVAFMLFLSSVSAQEDEDIVAKGAELKQAGNTFDFTEGPAVAKDGKVYFTDQPNDKIYVWDENKGISLYKEGTGRANGMYFDNKGRLVACADGKNQLVYFDENKTMHVLYEKYNGKLLNGPNDVWIRADGGIYFSDPYFHRDYWDPARKEEQDKKAVYYMSPDGKVKRVIDDYVMPNGIVGTPDGKTLYVSDMYGRKIWKYKIEPNGDLTEKTLFVEQGADGMTIDNKGNIYLALRRVQVYSPEGKLIKEISVPETPSNLCFGGKNRNILFITARKGVYTLEMNVHGVN